jgi:hypothetical protein
MEGITMRCAHCADRSSRDVALRAHVGNLVALLEHPTALPPEAALRIAGELLAWLGDPPTRLFPGAAEIARDARAGEHR